MKFRQFANRELLRRSLPHGLVSPYYLLPHQSLKIRTHRRLWLRALPRIPLPIFLMMEAFLYLRWMLFSSWRFTFLVVRRLGPGIRDREGMGLFTQFVRVIVMSLLHAVPPSEIYAFRLYMPNRHTRIWDYVFTHEVVAFHQWRDLQYGKNGGSVRLLGDKKDTAEILSRQGVPVIPTLDALYPGADVDPSPFLTTHPRLFLKPRHGSAGRGCFVVERNENGYGFSVFKTRSGMVTSRITWARLKDELTKEAYLIQPHLLNHPQLAELCETQDTVTVRVITEAPNGASERCFSAMLEIPGPVNDPQTGKPPAREKRGHIIVPIDVTTGKTLEYPPDRTPIPALDRYRSAYERAQGKSVPFWEQILKNACVAHSFFPDVYAIAWDYVIGQDSPYLLEGNTGWGTRIPQMIHGGLLGEIRSRVAV